MEERFADEFVTWYHKTPVGVKVDEVFGMDSKKGRAWEELARQIFCEQIDSNYRVIDHFDNGAPFLEGYPGRISITHTRHFYAVALLPKTPEAVLTTFNTRTAMGIDAEPLDRKQVLKVRDKFLSDRELEMISEDNIEENIVAWTSKEAMYKSAFRSGIDIRNSLQIIQLPSLIYDEKPKKDNNLGKGLIVFPEESGIKAQEMILYSYVSYGCCVTIAISPKAAKFG